MKTHRSVVAGTALAVATMGAAAMGTAGPAAAGSAAAGSAAAGHPAYRSAATVTLPDSAAPFAAGRADGAVPGANALTIQFWLAPQDAAASYATAVSTPGSPLYRHFLSPAAYTARFAATPLAAESVESWLKSQGFTGVTEDQGRDYVQATAPVSTIDTALKTRLRYYGATASAGAGGYRLRANDQPVSLPAAVAASVLGVTGLDNAAPVMTYIRAGVPTPPTGPAQSSPTFACSHWYLQNYATGLPAMFGTTKFPTAICGYTPQQLRAAYSLSSGDVGTGTTIALVEVGLTPDMFHTLATYASTHGIQAPSTQRYTELSIGQGSQCGDPFNVEEQLDVEASYDMAPMANQLVVGGDSCNNGFFGLQALYDADLAVLNGSGGRPLASIVSNSWEAGAETIPADELDIEDAYLIKAAAEGVSMLFSAGDLSGVESPSSDPWATAVGGTTLAIGQSDQRLFETGWSTGISTESNGAWAFQGEDGASGGGPSLLWAQPAYQRAVVPAALATPPGNRGGLVRAVPDISADADPFTGMDVGMLTFNASGGVTGYSEQAIGGTSLAVPLVAGIVADAEQGHRPFGYLNPALYKLAKTTAFNDVLPLSGTTMSAYRGVACDAATCGVLLLTTFDDQSYSMQGYTGQVTAPGYDTMTGLGTPDGQKFITGLRGT